MNPIIEQLRAAAHGNKTFGQHLDNTAAFLVRMGQPTTIVEAGRYHAIYGTQGYRIGAKVSRQEVQAEIGVLSEMLAYLFCTVDRSKLFTDGVQMARLTKEVLNIPINTLNALRVIEVANLRDQNLFDSNKIVCDYAVAQKWVRIVPRSA